MAARYDVQGIPGPTTDTQVANFRAVIDAKEGWTFIALVDPGHTIFEVVDDPGREEVQAEFTADAVVLGVPINYPRQ